MDRFATRTPSWKTLNYNRVVAQAVNKRPEATKSTANQPNSSQKKPLQQKQLADFSTSQDISRRLSEIFRPSRQLSTEASTVENYNGNSNDSGLSSASSVSPPTTTVYNGEELCIENATPAEQCQTPTKNNLGKLGDYVDCPEEKENDTCMTITRTPKSSKKALDSMGLKENNNSPSKQLPQTPKTNKQRTLPTVAATALTAEKQQTPTKNPMLMSRIQRDLNSPSASVRVRALKAIASPTKSPYAHFDIPDAEQSLNFSNTQDSRDIKDVMRNVIVYVEVRSGEDNRSEGVRKVIEALGARVNLTLTKDTTHVVFKEGRLSTFKKAQQWRIPVVSILWIEACKTRNRICDPKEFPISNLDRYENPELYSKMKIFRHMQPGSECNKRKVKTPSNTKDTTTPTQKTGTCKKNSTLIGTTPSSSTSNHKKTDISQFFKKLDKTNKVLTTPEISTTTAAGNTVKASIQSPATELLNRITSECYMPLQSSKTATKDVQINGKKSAENIQLQNDEESRESICNLDNTNKVKKALNFFQSRKEVGSTTIVKGTPSTKSRRRSSVAAVAAAATVNNKKESAEHFTPSRTSKVQTRRSTLPSEDTNIMVNSETPARNTRRRSSIHTVKNMSIETARHEGQFNVISEEAPVVAANGEGSVIPSKESQTLHSMHNMDIAEESKAGSGLNSELNHPTAISSRRRRTVYSYKIMNESGIKAALNPTTSSFAVAKGRPTCYSVKSIQTDTITDVVSKDDANGTKSIEDTEKNLTENSADLANTAKNLLNNKEEESLESEAAKKPATAVKSIRRRTLYTPKKSDAGKNERQTAGAVSLSVSDGLCITPTASNMQGKVAACSTMLEWTENNSPTNLIETPPAAALSGKLLEGTTESATPYLFNSARQPGNKRRTLFDASMDIITQRLQCINQSARRSLIPNLTDNINNNTNVKSTGDNKNKTIILPETDSENSTPQHSASNDFTPSSDCVASAILNKKRKLFIPNETVTPPPIVASAVINNKLTATPLTKNRRDSLNSSAVKNLTMSSSVTTSTEKCFTKRRRTLMPFSQPTVLATASNLSKNGHKAEEESSSSTLLRMRRSTLDFEQIQNKIIHNEEKSADETTTPIASEKAAKTDVKSKKMPVIVYTNMHKEQIDVIREAVDKLGNCNLEQTVSDSTTHLVSLEPRRTMNLLRALVRGLWIVEYSWVLDSMKAGELLPEEPYELQGFSRAIEICRSERQAFGNIYKCELFRDFGQFYISLRCYPVRRDDLIELITLCGGSLSQNRNKARYIIGDPNAVLDDKVYITPYWVLDSISQMQIMKVQKYLYLKPFERPQPISQLQK